MTGTGSGLLEIETSLQSRLAEVSRQMIRAMIIAADVEQVILDLKPAVVDLPADYLALAQQGYLVARSIGVENSMMHVDQIIGPSIQSIAKFMPDVWRKSVRTVAEGHASVERMAMILADLVAVTVFHQIGKAVASQPLP